MRLSYVFESRNGLNMDYISIKGVFGIPSLPRPFRVAIFLYSRFPKPIRLFKTRIMLSIFPSSSRSVTNKLAIQIGPCHVYYTSLSQVLFQFVRIWQFNDRWSVLFSKYRILINILIDIVIHPIQFGSCFSSKIMQQQCSLFQYILFERRWFYFLTW